MGKSKLTLFILAGLVLGIIFGWAYPETAISLKPLADVFLRMIKMIIAPLVFATLVVGIAGHGGLKNLGNIALKTIIYFEIASIIALFLGLFAGQYFQPGAGLNIDISNANVKEVEALKGTHSMPSSPIESLVHMVPTSVVEAMAKGDILQIVIFAVFFALALGAIGRKSKPILWGLNSLAEVMFKFTSYVMYFAPIGVFAAIAAAVGKEGIDVLFVYAKLIFALYFTLFIFVITVRVLSCKIANVPFIPMMKALKDPILLAFSTASSEAALPKAMETMEKFGVPKNIVSFVMPTGYTFNLDGSTLYLSLATLFVAQISNVELSFGQQMMIMFSLMLTSKGIAAVPRVSLVVLTGTLISFNIPVEGVALLLGIDQILDMGRTTVNLIGNCVATAIIACWDKTFDYDKMNKFIAETQGPGFFATLKTKLGIKQPVTETVDVEAYKSLAEDKEEDDPV